MFRDEQKEDEQNDEGGYGAMAVQEKLSHHGDVVEVDVPSFPA